MKGRSSKQETEEGTAIDKLKKLKEEPHLSGAYIRSLVKKLTSSRTEDSMNPKERGCLDADGFSSQSKTKFGEDLSASKQTRHSQQSEPHKKQVRRRLHTSKPYQERLLNMAEARREIVTALKFHRASMKQANEQRQQQKQQQQQQFQPLQQQQQQQCLQQSSLPISSPPCSEEKGNIKSRRNPRTNQSSTAHYSNYLDNICYTSPSPHPAPYAFSWPTPIFPTSFSGNFNVPLPDQTLGLNLNFQDFNNIDTSLYRNDNYPSSVYSTPSPSSSSPLPLSMSAEEIPLEVKRSPVVPPAVSDVIESYGGGGAHQVMDDDEMAEIRSIGEQHQMEWNDTMSLVTSAWWFNFLKTMDLGPGMKDEDDGYHPFDQVMEFPAWLNANDGCLQHLNDYYSEDYFNDPALPRMEIEEIEGMDGEWLA